ncbi:unnamed protein product [Closterium sp. Yama58-4]|nr:unnamed protein product [Closterium sp. Yama58-4]
MEVLIRRADLDAKAVGAYPEQQLPPLVFIHGSYHAAWCWADKWMPYLSALGFDCFAISILGQGGSDVPNAPVAGTIQSHAADVSNVIRQLVGRPPVLVGHSFGGLIVQAYLADVAKDWESSKDGGWLFADSAVPLVHAPHPIAPTHPPPPHPVPLLYLSPPLSLPSLISPLPYLSPPLFLPSLISPLPDLSPPLSLPSLISPLPYLSPPLSLPSPHKPHPRELVKRYSAHAPSCCSYPSSFLSPPPRPPSCLLGSWELVKRYMRTRPMLSIKITLSLAAKLFRSSLSLCRDSFFSPALPEADVKRYQALLSDSSKLPLFDLRLLNASLPVAKPPAYCPPVMVLGAADDVIVDDQGVKETAEFFSTETVVLAGMPHDIMLDLGWKDVPCTCFFMPSFLHPSNPTNQDDQGVKETAEFFSTEAVVLPGMPHDIMLDLGWKDAADAMLQWLASHGAIPKQ